MPRLLEKQWAAVASAAQKLGRELDRVFQQFAEAEGDVARAGLSEQQVEALRDLFEQLARLTERLRLTGAEPEVEVFPDVVMTPGVNAGKPRFAGTRIFVALVYWRFAAGADFRQLRDELQGVTADQLKAAVEYALALSKEALHEAARKAG